MDFAERWDSIEVMLQVKEFEKAALTEFVGENFSKGKLMFKDVIVVVRKMMGSNEGL